MSQSSDDSVTSPIFTTLVQENFISSRNVRNEDLNHEITVPYVPLEENNAYFNGYFVPPVLESSRYNNLRANYPRGRMPIPHHSSSSSRKEVVEQEDRQRIRENPPSTRLIGNRLYDPSFAARGEPVDPYLRILKANPNFFKIAPKTEAGDKGKMTINLNN